MPRLVYLTGLALLLLAITFLLTHELLWQPGVTEGNARRIRAGMALGDVEALLGGAAGQEISPQLWSIKAHPRGRLVPWFRIWGGAPGQVWVRFDRQDRVEWAGFSPAGAAQPGPLDRLSSQIGW